MDSTLENLADCAFNAHRHEAAVDIHLARDGSMSCTLVNESTGMPLDYVPDTAYVRPDDSPAALGIVGMVILLVAMLIEARKRVVR